MERIPIIIGADELILWLRKNRRAENCKTQELGKNIWVFIRDSLRGSKVEPDPKPTYWGKNDPAFKSVVHPEGLPYEATQYQINTCDLAKLYEELLTW